MSEVVMVDSVMLGGVSIEKEMCNEAWTYGSLH